MLPKIVRGATSGSYRVAESTPCLPGRAMGSGQGKGHEKIIILTRNTPKQPADGVFPSLEESLPVKRLYPWLFDSFFFVHCALR